MFFRPHFEFSLEVKGGSRVAKEQSSVNKKSDPLSRYYHFWFPKELAMASDRRNATRPEKDSLGVKEIPANVYYGIQTARAVENYPISGMRAHPTLIRAFGMVKEAAAEAH